jgi:hypothetical protein
MGSKITDKDKLSTALTGELLGTIRDFAEAEPDADSPDVVLVAVLDVFRLSLSHVTCRECRRNFRDMCNDLFAAAMDAAMNAPNVADSHLHEKIQRKAK